MVAPATMFAVYGTTVDGATDEIVDLFKPVVWRGNPPSSNLGGAPVKLAFFTTNAEAVACAAALNADPTYLKFYTGCLAQQYDRH